MSYINSCTGLDLDAKQIASLLSRMALTATASPSADSVHVKIPPSRSDILHDCDVMEVRCLISLHAAQGAAETVSGVYALQRPCIPIRAAHCAALHADSGVPLTLTL